METGGKYENKIVASLDSEPNHLKYESCGDSATVDCP